MTYEGQDEPVAEVADKSQKATSSSTDEAAPASSKRGFATLRPERRRLISSKGGRAAHKKGSAHQFTSEEAREAGRKGGQASAKSRAKKA